MRGFVSRFLGARGGNLATMAALVSPLFLAVAAFCVDTSSLFLERRQLQNMADLAAVAGAASLSQANEAVLRQLQANGVDPVLMTDGYDPSIVNGKADNKTRVWVEKGNYFPDKGRAVEDRFVAGGANPDAVRVRLARPGNLYFGQSFINRPALGATGTAATKAEAAFSVGSRLLSLNTTDSALNSLLGELLGTSLDLKLVDYNALAATDINLLGFLDKLAPKVGLTAGTYQKLLDTEVSVGTLASVMAEVVTNNPAAGAALTLLGKNAGALNTKLPVGKLLGLGSIADVALGSSNNYNITANVLQMISAAAMLGGEHQLQLGPGIKLPGLLGLKLDIAIGEPAQNTPFFAVGGAGTLVRTAQVRLLLTLDVGSEGVVSYLANVHVPIFIDVASAEAQLKSISCPQGPGSATVRLGVKPGVVGVYLGDTDIDLMKNFSKTPAVKTTTIAEVKALFLKVAELRGRVQLPLGNPKEEIKTFTSADIAAKRVQTASTSKLVGSLFGGLITGLDLEVVLSGVLPLPLGGLTQLLGILLQPLAPAVDGLLFGILDLLGVKLGEADVQVTGVLCQRAVLTQ
ncbi:pilus assembly protein TadG-related protein [Brucella intermedia]|uniref:pilus assembly protein TadG-related protein n=1 Tax=Brucella intermedia TaxID=94625 RepID=UPI00046A3F07|nr:pilus assembly protein TadG-related protein [Brucella intermedia]UXO82578.1 pilus assembly protein TadG-related protein [Brucella intermedia]WGJ06191.1 TadG family pilus assembly protein [Brucella intermedia]